MHLSVGIYIVLSMSNQQYSGNLDTSIPAPECLLGNEAQSTGGGEAGIACVGVCVRAHVCSYMQGGGVEQNGRGAFSVPVHPHLLGQLQLATLGNGEGSGKWRLPQTCQLLGHLRADSVKPPKALKQK